MGSRTIGSLLVRLGMDAKDADKSIKAFEKNLKDTGRRMESIGRTMSIGFTAPFVLGMRQAIKAFDEEAAATRKLEIALGRTSSALLNQAAAIQKTTTFADDAVINVQAYAAALGHSEAQVQKMTTAAVGLAAGLGIGLEEAMAMLHKSTLGASKGLGQLIPGVKEMTKEQLKSGAAIDLVTDKFSGYAEKLATTGAGPLKQFQNRFGDLMEQFGEAALPILNKVIDKFTALTEWFSKLNPATKEWLVNLGGVVALSGPILMMSGNVLKLAASFKTLGGSMGFLTNPYVASVLLALAAGEGLDYAFNKDANGNRIVKTDQGGRQYTQSFGSEMALGVEGRQYIQQPTTVSPAAFNSANQLFNQFISASGVRQPFAGYQSPDILGGNGGGGGSENDDKKKRNASDYLVPESFGNVIGFGDMFSTPSDYAGYLRDELEKAIGGLGYTAYSKEDGPDNVMPMSDNFRQANYTVPITDADLQSTSSLLDGQKNAVDQLNQGYLALGNSIASVMSSVASSLAEGGDAFVAFGKAALLAGAQVVKAMLMASVARATEKGAAVAGAPGIIIGATLGIAAISIVEGLLSKIKTPKLAMGGQTMGPTMALIGDNPSGKEMVLPFERTGEFARAIGSQMGGGTSKVVGVIRGRDIHLVTSQEQGYASRRGSGNLITF